MKNSKTFEELTCIKDGKISIKEHTKLVIDRIYESNRNSSNISSDILSKLMFIKNQGGIRYIGTLKPFNVSYVVLYTTGEDKYWVDYFDIETGILTYYGDNKISGSELHSTNIHGNEILRNIFNLASNDSFEDRMKVPAIFVFEKAKKFRDVKFLGLAVPGASSINQMDWLVALWASRSDKTRFQNYRAKFTILDTSSGSKISPNDASIDIEWLNDLKNGKGYASDYAPLVWRKWIDDGTYTPLCCKQEKLTRSKKEQLPSTQEDMRILSSIYDFFSDNPYKFEKFAIDIAFMLDNNILDIEHTRLIKDGGRDGVGIYRVGIGDSTVTFPFVVEAKCYNIDNAVRVTEMSRLISRIKMREFGILITTSYVGQQAYDEIIEDNHPIIIVSGKDIIDLLHKNGFYTYKHIINLLKKYEEKN